MKKIITLLAFSSIIFNSCSSNDPDPVENTAPTLVGTWKEVKTEKISGTNSTVISTTPVAGCDTMNNFVFTADNKFTFKVYTNTNNTCVIDYTTIGTYSYNSSTKTLSITESGSIENIYVEGLTATNFITVENLNSDYNNDGVNDKERITLVRQ